jgi:hypothetical protein
MTKETGGLYLKEAGKRIQVFKTDYVPAERTAEGHLIRGTGRSRPTIVGSFKSTKVVIPTKIADHLTDDQVKKAQKRLDDYHLQKRVDRQKRLASRLPELMREFSENLGLATLSQTQVDDLFSAYADMKKKMTKYSYKKSKTTTNKNCMPSAKNNRLTTSKKRGDRPADKNANISDVGGEEESPGM